MILVGDIGGTKTLIALYQESEAGLSPVSEATYPSRDYPSLDAILHNFLGRERRGPIRAACFAVAGPVIDGRIKTVNLPWELDERTLAGVVQARVKLLNDLEGAGYGLPLIGAGEIEILQPGAQREGNMVLIAAGTGLGEALLIRNGDGYRVVATEGGHADFAPRSDREVALLEYLRKEYGHVSYERIVSGPGLHNIYRFLRDSGYATETEWLRERLAAGDPSAGISEVAQTGSHPLCVETLELFAAIYGAEAGNLALKSLAFGGVFVGGGIAPKILWKLCDGSFVRGFVDKGRLSELMRSIRVGVVLNPHLPLIGAAWVAGTLAETLR